MANIDFPAELQAKRPLKSGWSEMLQDETLRSQMDTGAPKVRRRFTAGSTILNLSYRLTTYELNILEMFYKNILGAGTQKFNFEHPRTAITKDTRFEEPYSVKPGGVGFWIVTYNLRVFE